MPKQKKRGKASPAPAPVPPKATEVARVAPAGAHQWVSFPDPVEQRTWLFDVTFLLSGWKCLYGTGCQGVLTGPSPELEQGCCSYGAHFTGAADRDRVVAAAATLSADQWQFRRRGQRGGTVIAEADGTPATRLVDGACIFLNRPGFAGGAGCALHRAALDTGRRPMDLKPDVCWQLPLRREDLTDDNGHVTSVVTQWERRHWGDGGDEFHWWCTEAPDAFAAPEPLYRRLQDELVGLCGEEIYRAVAAYLDILRPAATVPLPHPTVRRS